MKRILILLSVMGAISITQFANAEECVTNKDGVNVELSTQNDWEDLGSIKVFSGYYYTTDYAQLYVKVISGKTFYKIKLTTGNDINEEYAVSKNPEYNPNGTEWQQKYTHVAGRYYFKF